MDSCLGFLFFVLFCSVFLVYKINVRPCVSPPAMTRQTPVGGTNTCRGVTIIITSLAKEVMFLVALVNLSVCLSVCLFVCLFVCLSVDNITQKVMNGLG